MIPETPEERQKRFDMYEEVTTNFQEAMIKELDANSSKGDRKGSTGWLSMTNKENLSELYYHVGKLQEALRNENIDGIKEFSADVAWKFVYDILMKNGYKRTGYNSGLLKQFDDATVYDMYVNKDFERLEQYYSLPFVKIN